MKESICNGKGIYKYLSGVKYEGYMKRFKRKGRGILYNGNGDILMQNEKNIAKGSEIIALTTGEAYIGTL